MYEYITTCIEILHKQMENFKSVFPWRRKHAAEEMSPCTREEKWIHLVTSNTISESRI